MTYRLLCNTHQNRIVQVIFQTDYRVIWVTKWVTMKIGARKRPGFICKWIVFGARSRAASSRICSK